ncbi:MAG: STM4015 family protein [Planctomycetaceae bacterium]
MVNGSHLTEFDGKPVVDFRPGMTLNPETTTYRLRRDYGDEFEFADLFAEFVSSDGADRVTGLITGAYSEEMFDESEGMGSVVEAVVAAAPQLASLTALFLGDIVMEENEISWIWQSDLSPLWTAYPRLQTLMVRGGQGLDLGSVVHDQLRTLIIQTGGLPRQVVQQVAAAKLPELRHLELYLGEENYGGDSTVDDLRPFFADVLFPKLKYLGIKNSPLQNDIAVMAAESPVVKHLEVLDLSLGTLTDEGAQALLAHADQLSGLKLLNLEHHFLTTEVMNQLQALPIEVNTAGQEQPDRYGDEIYRYISVSE